MQKITFRLVESSPLRYLLALPEAAELRKEPAPVLCFLHGLDEGVPMKIEYALTRHGPLHPENPAETIGKFIVIAPQLPVRGDLWHYYADDVHFIVEDVRKNHKGDIHRTYLTGFSFGGNGVFDLALQQPGCWAALWPVDPTRIPKQDPERPVCLYFGVVARSRKAGFIRALHLRSHEEAPGADRLYLDEGADHVGAARRSYGDVRIYSWLLSKRLP